MTVSTIAPAPVVPTGAAAPVPAEPAPDMFAVLLTACVTPTKPSAGATVPKDGPSDPAMPVDLLAVAALPQPMPPLVPLPLVVEAPVATASTAAVKGKPVVTDVTCVHLPDVHDLKAVAPGQVKEPGTSAKAFAPGQVKEPGTSAKAFAPGQVKKHSEESGAVDPGPVTPPETVATSPVVDTTPVIAITNATADISSVVVPTQPPASHLPTEAPKHEPTHAVRPALAAAAKRLTHEGGRTSLVVRLDPPELGAVLVRMTVREGQVEVTLRAPDLAAQGGLLAQAPEIQQVLKEAGLDLTSFDVTYGEMAKGQSEEHRQTPDRGTPHQRGNADGTVHVMDDVTDPQPAGTWL